MNNKKSSAPIIIILLILIISGGVGFYFWMNKTPNPETPQTTQQPKQHPKTPHKKQRNGATVPKTEEIEKQKDESNNQPKQHQGIKTLPNEEQENQEIKVEKEANQPKPPKNTFTLTTIPTQIDLTSLYSQELDNLKELSNDQFKLALLNDLSNRISESIENPELESDKTLLSNLHNSVKTTRKLASENIKTQKTITTKTKRAKENDTKMPPNEERIAILRRVYNKEKYSVAQLIEAGATIQDMKVIGYTADELIASNKFTDEEIVNDKGKRFLTLSYDETEAEIKKIEKEITDLRTEKVNLLNEIMKLDITNELDQQLKNDLKKNNILFQNTMNSITESLTSVPFDKDEERQILNSKMQSLKNAQEQKKKLQEQYENQLNKLVAINDALSDFKRSLVGIKVVVERAEQAKKEASDENLLNSCATVLFGDDSYFEKIKTKEDAQKEVLKLPKEDEKELYSIIKAISYIAEKQNKIDEKGNVIETKDIRKLKKDLTANYVFNLECKINVLIQNQKNEIKIKELETKNDAELKEIQNVINQEVAKIKTIINEKIKTTNNSSYLVLLPKANSAIESQVDFDKFIDEKLKSLKQDFAIKHEKTTKINKVLDTVDHIRRKQQELLKYCKAIKSPIASRLQEVINENKEQKEILDRVKQRLY